MTEDQEYQAWVEAHMKQTMDVFTTQGSSGGRYDVAAGTDVPCSLVRIGTGSYPSVPLRAEMGRMRQLTFPTSYDMPRRARVVIDGRTWQVSADTLDFQNGPGGDPIAQTCDVVLTDRSNS